MADDQIKSQDSNCLQSTHDQSESQVIRSTNNFEWFLSLTFGWIAIRYPTDALMRNPYSPPPSEIDSAPISAGTWRSILRFAILGYGLLYTILCVASLVDDIWSQSSLVWIAINTVIDTLTCVGIFAFVVRAAQRPWMLPVWNVFGLILPFALAITTIWEIVAFVPSPTSIELAASVAVYVLLVSPAVWINFRLLSRLTELGT